MTDIQEKHIKFFGNQIKRDEALDFIDTILKEKGNFEDFGDLTAGLFAVVADYRIMISDDDDSYGVEIVAVSGGDPLNFTVHKETKTVLKPSTDEVAQDLGDDDMDFLDEV